MIRTVNLVHRYGDVVAVDSVSLSIPDGECVVLAGANGSGKTTLVRHFNGLLESDEGRVEVNGRRVGADLVAARTAVGIVFQEPRDQLVAATVGADVAFGPENLGLGRAEIDRRVAASLSAVDLDGRKGVRVGELSGGERQRVAVAGALAMEPDHLVLDEPFTGLDAPARTSVVDRLRELSASGTGLVIVTHDLRDVLDLADRVVAMAEGRVVVDAPPDEAAASLPAYGVRVPDPACGSTSAGPDGDGSSDAAPRDRRC
ncbi:ABC transporter ATP-binding protein [Halobellus salinus]|uniref:ABC transporter ATP-binding protein n=1 Tax=Halobellus salinus TaxID=931585 RepID=A0A830EQ10_9EURY|nr:ABC transporter ATP-binding protein [Halobellus salinus]GGJ12593.1 ABC transporter ATP-binding protein [Halobellus salinus]SMP28835.1 biotin transport system ATP-binding protein [Halobellus salinus]